ncbi:acyl-CoA thioesterase [Exilibacterium tricleocarpae]|uniref:Acyl-CoA thioesterase n=2 Tax=Exilibacterium tricleocarpae TaxID=2591008 RepID=A0A545T1Y6_9GAMM|nr:acyl-CoA thioesterase [Exilibacterium tricleocarpae]
MATRDSFDFSYALRVRYSEIDAQGVVFNAHYLTYFDTALNEYMRHLDIDYQGMVEKLGVDFHLVKSTVEYLGPIHFDELIDIALRPVRIGRSSITWELAIFRSGESECLTRGEVVWVCAEVGRHQSHPIPAEFVDLLPAI